VVLGLVPGQSFSPGDFTSLLVAWFGFTRNWQVGLLQKSQISSSLPFRESSDSYLRGPSGSPEMHHDCEARSELGFETANPSLMREGEVHIRPHGTCRLHSHLARRLGRLGMPGGGPLGHFSLAWSRCLTTGLGPPHRLVASSEASNRHRGVDGPLMRPLQPGAAGVAYGCSQPPQIA
jgi:hypothetical protein